MNTLTKKINAWLEMPLRTALYKFAFAVFLLGSLVYLLTLAGIVTAVIRDVVGLAPDTAQARVALPSIFAITVALCWLTYFFGKRAFTRKASPKTA